MRNIYSIQRRRTQRGGEKGLWVSHILLTFFSLNPLIPTQKSTIFRLDILFYPWISSQTLCIPLGVFFLPKYSIPRKNPSRTSRRLDMWTLDFCFTFCLMTTVWRLSNRKPEISSFYRLKTQNILVMFIWYESSFYGHSSRPFAIIVLSFAPKMYKGCGFCSLYLCLAVVQTSSIMDR